MVQLPPDDSRRLSAILTASLPKSLSMLATPDGVTLLVATPDDLPDVCLTFTDPVQAAALGASMIAGAVAVRDGTAGHPPAPEVANDHIAAVIDGLRDEAPLADFRPAPSGYAAELGRQREAVRVRDREIARLRKELGRYTECRHAVPQCFCTREACAALEARPGASALPHD